MTINERFDKIIRELYSGNKRAFASAIGVAPTVIENVVGSRQGKPSFDVIAKVCALANVNTEWVISGKGEMIEEELELPTVSKKKVKRDLSKTRPRIPIDAAAGSLSFALGGVRDYEFERFPVIPQFPKYDFTIIARGDSMEPELESGDELACLFVQESSFIQWGRVHIIDTEQGVVVKRIFDKGDSILCKSTNPEYEPFKIPKREVYRMALVVGVIRRY